MHLDHGAKAVQLIDICVLLQLFDLKIPLLSVAKEIVPKKFFLTVEA